MTEDRDKDRDSLLAMKDHGPIAKIGKWTGAVAAVIGLLSQIVPPIWDAIIGDDVDQLKADVAGCQGDLKAQKELLRAAVKATEDRIVEAEKVDLEIEGSIRLIGAEVRLRHGGDVDDLPIDNIPRSRSGRLRAIAEQNDERLSGDGKRRQGASLVEDMRRQGAPVDALNMDR